MYKREKRWKYSQGKMSLNFYLKCSVSISNMHANIDLNLQCLVQANYSLVLEASLNSIQNWDRYSTFFLFLKKIFLHISLRLLYIPGLALARLTLLGSNRALALPCSSAYLQFLWPHQERRGCRAPSQPLAPAAGWEERAPALGPSRLLSKQPFCDIGSAC